MGNQPPSVISAVSPGITDSYFWLLLHYLLCFVDTIEQTRFLHSPKGTSGTKPSVQGALLKASKYQWVTAQGSQLITSYRILNSALFTILVIPPSGRFSWPSPQVGPGSFLELSYTLLLSFYRLATSP